MADDETVKRSIPEIGIKYDAFIWVYLLENSKFIVRRIVMHILTLFMLTLLLNCEVKKNYVVYKPRKLARHPQLEGSNKFPQDYFSYRHYLENGTLIFQIEVAPKYGGGPAEKRITWISVHKLNEKKADWFVLDSIEMGNDMKKIIYGVEPYGFETRVKPEALIQKKDYVLDIDGYESDGGEMYYFRYE